MCLCVFSTVCLIWSAFVSISLRLVALVTITYTLFCEVPLWRTFISMETLRSLVWVGALEKAQWSIEYPPFGYYNVLLNYLLIREVYFCVPFDLIMKLRFYLFIDLFMANRWGNNGNREFILGGSKITADGDCSHEIKRCLLLGRKAMLNLDSLLKNRDITLPTKVCLLKITVSPLVMYGCKSWTIKKAECWRIDAFELWCWRRLLSWLQRSRREWRPVSRHDCS